ncbi:hypothetical protein [Thioclava pacifica]|uniref:hypothetical protein n=1 Tax=Thioclava pacifica TaxID=285109 RepID=UPI0012F97B86|nr:hypothetical protein [Thioclava pacifica]
MQDRRHGIFAEKYFSNATDQQETRLVPIDAFRGRVARLEDGEFTMRAGDFDHGPISPIWSNQDRSEDRPKLLCKDLIGQRDGDASMPETEGDMPWLGCLRKREISFRLVTLFLEQSRLLPDPDLLWSGNIRSIERCVSDPLQRRISNSVIENDRTGANVVCDVMGPERRSFYIDVAHAAPRLNNRLRCQEQPFAPPLEPLQPLLFAFAFTASAELSTTIDAPAPSVAYLLTALSAARRAGDSSSGVFSVFIMSSINIRMIVWITHA